MAIVCSVATEAMWVALTFDDGPHGRYTERVLDILAGEGARATFFVRGSALDPETIDIVKRTRSEGHDVGNHTHHHLDFDLYPDVVSEEVMRTHFQLEEILGHPPDLIRPPYGRGLDRVDAIASSLGYRATVKWSVLANDWENPPAGTIIERVLADLAPGAIVLLHDGVDGRQQEGPRYSPQGTVEALPELIAAIRERGYEPISVSRLLDG